MSQDSRKLAVVIGVNAYTNQATDAQLLGAVNDAKGWFHILRRLGYRSEDIRVLSGPTLTNGQLYDDDVVIQEATRQNIIEATHWVREQAERSLAAGQHVGVTVAVSGHGDFTKEGGFAIMPSDYAPGAVPALSVAWIGEQLKPLQRELTTTFFLDTCRQGAAATTGAPHDSDLSDYFDVKTNVFVLAARAGEESYERCIGGEWRGLFSWATQRVLEQWSVKAGATGAYLNITYQELADRVGRLLAQLNPFIEVEGELVPIQQTALLASQENRQLAVANLLGHGDGETSSNPTAKSNGHEFPTGTTGNFKPSGGGAVFGTLSVGGSASSATATYNFNPANPWSSSNFTLKFEAIDPLSGATAFTAGSSPLSKVSGSPQPAAPSGGKLYAANSQTIYLSVSSNGKKLTWWCREDSLVDGYLPNTGQLGFVYKTQPGPAHDDWYNVVEDLK